MISFSYASDHTARALNWMAGDHTIHLKCTIKELVKRDIFSVQNYDFDRDLQLARGIDSNGVNHYSEWLADTDYKIYGLKYAIHGIDLEFKYRIPQLRFTIKEFPQSKTDLIFALKFTLEQGTEKTVICMTELYRVTSITPIPKTGQTDPVKGVIYDAEMEAIPWIYFYNGQIRGCQTDHGYPGDAPTTISDYAFWDSIQAILRRQKVVHDLEYVEDTETVPEEVKLSPYSGVLMSWNNGTTTSIEDRSTAKAWFNCSYEGSVLSALSWLMLPRVLSQIIYPEIYGGEFYSESDYQDNPLLAPTARFFYFGQRLLTPGVFQGVAYFWQMSDFIVEDDNFQLEDVSYGYRLYKYDSKSETENLNFYSILSPVTNPVLIEMEFSSQTGNDIQLSLQNMFIDGAESVNRYKGIYDTFQCSKEGFWYCPRFNIEQFISSGEVFSLLFIPISVTRTLTDVNSQGKTAKKIIDIDLRGVDGGESFGQVTLPQTFSRIKKKAVFYADWRPWINIYDIVKITYFDLGANWVTSYAMVYDIEADMDSLRAKYSVWLTPTD